MNDHRGNELLVVKGMVEFLDNGGPIGEEDVG